MFKKLFINVIMLEKDAKREETKAAVTSNSPM